MNWKIEETEIEGCFLISNPIFADARGSFSETYKETVFESLGLPKMVQDNHLLTAKGGIRAMHWQEGAFAQAKLINVVQGEIFDAVYDLRPNSKSFKKMATFMLNESSPLLFVPEDCAHGFQGVSNFSIVHYKTNKEYQADSQRAFHWNDPTSGIKWPISPAIVSEKDALAPSLESILKNV
jgi:dTDP-4-dehydrorhamnose 3,5-epimerase